MTKPIADAHWFERINQLLDQDLLSRDWPSEQLAKAMHYAVCNGGKRSRATLSYLIGEGLGLKTELIDPIAMAIECLHAYTLIHDDLPAMDDDDWRRHQPSCHKAFDEATAILAGDALQSHAFTLLSEGPSAANLKIAQIQFFANAVGAMGLCSGQSLDMIHEAQSTDFDTIKQIHHLKTGTLLAVACRLPGIAADLEEPELQQLQQFGEELGLLLQINDDLIDNLNNTGKSSGKDKEQNKACISNCLNANQTQQIFQQLINDCQTTLSNLHCLPTATHEKLSAGFLSEHSAILSSTKPR